MSFGLVGQAQATPARCLGDVSLALQGADITVSAALGAQAHSLANFDQCGRMLVLADVGGHKGQYLLFSGCQHGARMLANIHRTFKRYYRRRCAVATSREMKPPSSGISISSKSATR